MDDIDNLEIIDGFFDGEAFIFTIDKEHSISINADQAVQLNKELGFICKALEGSCSP